MSFSIIAIVVAAGASAYSAYDQSQAQKAQLNYQADVDAYNAKIAQNNQKMQADKRSDAIQRGAIETQRRMQQKAALIGKQRASLAANGVDVNQGGALDLLATTEFTAQQDANTIQSNAAREAWGHDVSASNYDAQSKLSIFSGKFNGKKFCRFDNCFFMFYFKVQESC